MLPAFIAVAVSGFIRSVCGSVLFALHKIKIWDYQIQKTVPCGFFTDAEVQTKHRLCRNVHEMTLYVTDRVRWHCNRSGCRTTVSLRGGKWFLNSRLPFQTVLCFIYFWVRETYLAEWCKREQDMSDKTIVNWNNIYRKYAYMFY